MRRLFLASAAAAVALSGLALASPARADDGPMQVPTTAPSFGNLSLAEGSAERSMANFIDRSSDDYGHYVGVPTPADRDVGVYRAPSVSTIYVLPPPRAWYTPASSSYEVRPVSASYGAAYLPPPARTTASTTTVYTPPCACARRR